MKGILFTLEFPSLLTHRLVELRNKPGNQINISLNYLGHHSLIFAFTCQTRFRLQAAHPNNKPTLQGSPLYSVGTASTTTKCCSAVNHMRRALNTSESSQLPVNTDILTSWRIEKESITPRAIYNVRTNCAQQT